MSLHQVPAVRRRRYNRPHYTETTCLCNFEGTGCFLNHGFGVERAYITNWLEFFEGTDPNSWNAFPHDLLAKIKLRLFC